MPKERPVSLGQARMALAVLELRADAIATAAGAAIEYLSAVKRQASETAETVRDLARRLPTEEAR